MAENDAEVGTSAKPTIDDLLKDVSASTQQDVKRLQRDFEDEFKAKSSESESKYVHIKGLVDHYKHKGWWSFWLLFLIMSMMLFQCILLVLVGLNKLSYDKYQWLLPALLVQNLAQVVGLAVFVVKSLFKDMRDDI